MRHSIVCAGLSLVACLSIFARSPVASAYCGPGGCGTIGTAPDDPPPKEPSEPEPQLTNRHALVWQGFGHAWDHHPHRMGDFVNMVEGTGHSAGSDVEVHGIRWATFKPGQDGDEGDLRTYVRRAVAAGLRTHQGEWEIELDDEVDSERTDCRASTVWEGTLSIDIGATGVSFEDYSVVLRGIDMDMTKEDGATGYIWPTVLDVDLGVCTRSGGTLSCQVRVEIVREDSPDAKPPEERMGYRIGVPYTVLLGGSGVLLEGPERAHAVSGRDYCTGPEVRAIVEPGLDPSYGVALTAITGYRFELTSDLDKAGRFLDEYDFHVEDLDYDQASGTLVSEATFGVGRDPSGAYEASLDATLRTRVVQIAAGAECADPATQEISDHVCIHSGVSWAYMGPCAVTRTSVTNTFVGTFPGSCL